MSGRILEGIVRNHKRLLRQFQTAQAMYSFRFGIHLLSGPE